MKRSALGIIAHVDSGKTTLSEALLYKTNMIRKIGRVDNKDAFLDTDEQEKNRGITIYSKQAVMNLDNQSISDQRCGWNPEPYGYAVAIA